MKTKRISNAFFAISGCAILTLSFATGCGGAGGSSSSSRDRSVDPLETPPNETPVVPGDGGAPTDTTPPQEPTSDSN